MSAALSRSDRRALQAVVGSLQGSLVAVVAQACAAPERAASRTVRPVGSVAVATLLLAGCAAHRPVHLPDDPPERPCLHRELEVLEDVPGWMLTPGGDDDLAVACEVGLRRGWFHAASPPQRGYPGLPVCNELLARERATGIRERVDAVDRRVERVLDLPRWYHDSVLLRLYPLNYWDEALRDRRAQRRIWELNRHLAAETRLDRVVRRRYVWRLFPWWRPVGGAWPEVTPGTIHQPDAVGPGELWKDPLDLNGGYLSLSAGERRELIRLAGSVWDEMSLVKLTKPEVSPEPELRLYAARVLALVRADPCSKLIGKCSSRLASSYGIEWESAKQIECPGWKGPEPVRQRR